MEAILNLQQLDVALLDQVVNVMYNGTGSEQKQAHEVLNQFKAHPDTWSKVDHIMENSQSENTKFLALKVLDECIASRWKILPPVQRDGIKNYIVAKVISLSSEEETLRSQHQTLSKLNYTLIQIVKQEWPQQWPNFIKDIVGSSKSNECLCENNMHLLKLLSEEVFDYSADNMTQAKIFELKESLNNDLSSIFELCQGVLMQGQKPSLLVATLECLLRFLNWMPLGYIFQTNLLETLILKFFTEAHFQNLALQCLSEVAAIDVPDSYGAAKFHPIMNAFMDQLTKILVPSPNMDLASVHAKAPPAGKVFLLHLALFFSNVYKNHILDLECQESQRAVVCGLEYCVELTKIEDPEIFKIMVELWHGLCEGLFKDASSFGPAAALQLGGLSGMSGSNSRQQWREAYAPVLSAARGALVSRMAKPEEVLIKTDETGNVVRVTLKDTEVSSLYKLMKDTIIYLTNLDRKDMETILLDKMSKQLTREEWGWKNLNRLCWAIGSISGAMSEDEEKRFLVTVIKDLLGLCETTRGKDNKAVIASDIMYIVGQYPRFLRAHWKFLKTVVNKLFEFMHEMYPGVRDMAVETFLKIAQKCRRKFVTVQVGETQTFIEEMLENLPRIIKDLEPGQIHVFYEAVGGMMRVQNSHEQRERLLGMLMQLPNDSWRSIMNAAMNDVTSLNNPEVAKNLANILKTNIRVCQSLGSSYVTQLSKIYLDMLNVYKAYSELISNAIAAEGPEVTRHHNIRAMLGVKKNTLTLVSTFIQNAEDHAMVSQQVIPPLMDPVLKDYQSNHPLAREAEVLALFAAIVEQLKQNIIQDVPRIFEAVLECTLQMITNDMTNFPEHRINLFQLLHAITVHCSSTLFAMNNDQFKLVIDSVVWAMKHTEPNISETGLKILNELFQQIVKTGQSSQFFFQNFYLDLIRDVFAIMTDTLHRPGLKLQSLILMEMFHLVAGGGVPVNLDPSGQSQDNCAYVQKYMMDLLAQSFPNLSATYTQQFVAKLVDLQVPQDAFRLTLRDFLVEMKAFSGDVTEFEDAEEKKQREQQQQLAVPGMIAPQDRPDWQN
eukprot:TRINITY_DN1363_c0_g1_i1.p1 TRINITY_DN1363_c0_g1~~TRINITY_DN1363_c0_g1_i1.p1  ORF type:complete len:1060 (+),score=349.96 TRINITY_DN1363_c0_g1_i1:415-3594(+)